MSGSATGVIKLDTRSSGCSSDVFRAHIGGMVHVILGNIVTCSYVPGPQLFIGLRI